MSKPVEEEFKEYGSVAILRLRTEEGSPKPAGKDYRPKAGDEIWVRSRGGMQWPVRLMKNHQGAPIFKFGSRVTPMIFDVTRQVWVVRELLG